MVLLLGWGILKGVSSGLRSGFPDALAGMMRKRSAETSPDSLGVKGKVTLVCFYDRSDRSGAWKKSGCAAAGNRADLAVRAVPVNGVDGVFARKHGISRLPSYWIYNQAGTAVARNLGPDPAALSRALLATLPASARPQIPTIYGCRAVARPTPYNRIGRFSCRPRSCR